MDNKQLDLLSGEKIMGYNPDYLYGGPKVKWSPTSYLEHAFQLLEKMADESQPRAEQFHFTVGRRWVELERRVYAGEPDTFSAYGTDICVNIVKACLMARGLIPVEKRE